MGKYKCKDAAGDSFVVHHADSPEEAKEIIEPSLGHGIECKKKWL